MTDSTTLQDQKALKELTADTQARYGALRTPRSPIEIALLYKAQVEFYENLTLQAEKLLRANGISPAYSVHHLSPAYLNDH